MTDPFGILEFVSRKMQTGLLGCVGTLERARSSFGCSIVASSHRRIVAESDQTTVNQHPATLVCADRYYGRWLLPVPRRIAVSVAVSPLKAPKIASPSAEEVEAFHTDVYGGLEKVFKQQRSFAGYPNKTLLVK